MRGATAGSFELRRSTVIGGGQDGQCGRGHGADQGLSAGKWTGSATSCAGAWAGEAMSCSSWPTPCCAEGPVHSLVGLCLTPEHRRGPGALCDAVNSGGQHAGRLRETPVRQRLPRMFGRADRARRRRLAVAAPGRADLSRAAVLPRLWTWAGGQAADSRLALSAGRWCSTPCGLGRPTTPPWSPPPSCAWPGTGSPVIRRSWWCSTPATTCTGWPSSWPTCRSS